MGYGLPFLSALWKHSKSSQWEKYRLYLWKPSQVAVGALFYRLEGKTNPPDCEANEICLKNIEFPFPQSQQYSNYGLSRAVLHLIAWSMGTAEPFF